MKPSKKNQAGLKTGLKDKERWRNPDLANCYSAPFLRNIRSVLAPKGRRSNAPAITVVGSGMGVPNIKNSCDAPELGPVEAIVPSKIFPV